MRNQCEEGEVSVDRPATREQFRPAADGIVNEARTILNGALPDYAAMLFWLKALAMLDCGQAASLGAVVATFSKHRLRALDLHDLGRQATASFGRKWRPW